MTHILDELMWRGLISQHTDLDVLRAAMDEGPLTFYTGYDPTASSLHIGNLVQLIVQRHLQKAGHKPLCLIGGSTGLIGDPKPGSERELNSPETVSQWTESIKTQVRPFLSSDGPNAAEFVNNLDWTEPMSALTFLRDIGKHFRVNQMIKKDAVSARLNSEQGISYTEFSYQILQGMDFLHLYRNHGCVLQTGGQDQWGNIMAGVDLVHRAEGASVSALTTPLVTTADGTKFGKSEGNAIWLDAELTSPYAFYQFWINVEDASVIRYLRLFSDLDQARIEELEQLHGEKPGMRAAHRALAENVTTLVHGEEACTSVQNASLALFGRGDLLELDERTLRDATKPLPTAHTTTEAISIVDAFVDSGLMPGRKAARRAVDEGGAYVNNVKITDADAPLPHDAFLFGKYALIRRGKKTLGAVILEK